MDTFIGKISVKANAISIYENIIGSAKADSITIGSCARMTAQIINFKEGKDSISVKNGALLTCNDIFGVASIKTTGSAKNRSLVKTGDLEFAENYAATLNIGTYSTATAGNIVMGKYNDTVKVGKYSLLTSQSFSFGEGNDKLTIQQDGKANLGIITKISGKLTITVGARSELTLIADVKTACMTVISGRRSDTKITCNDELAKAWGLATTEYTSLGSYKLVTLAMQDDTPDGTVLSANDNIEGWVGEGDQSDSFAFSADCDFPKITMCALDGDIMVTFYKKVTTYGTLVETSEGYWERSVCETELDMMKCRISSTARTLAGDFDRFTIESIDGESAAYQLSVGEL